MPYGKPTVKGPWQKGNFGGGPKGGYKGPMGAPPGMPPPPQPYGQKEVLKEKKAAKQILEQREPDTLRHSMGNAQIADCRDTACETAQNLDWDSREFATNAE